MSEVEYVLLSKIIQPPISGKRPSGGVDTETDGVPSLGGENILSNGGVKYNVIKRIPFEYYKLMPKGKLLNLDVLINKDGAQTGKVGLYKKVFEDAAINEHLFILRPLDSNTINPIYVYYCLLLTETQQKIERRITGSAQPGLNSSFVNAVSIPFYSIGIQQKIVTILTNIDTAIEKTEALTQKYQKIKAGLMHDLFTRGVTADGKLRPPREQEPELYQETPIGWVPREWKLWSLDDVSNVIDPNPSHRNPIYHPEGFPFISTVEFIDNDEVEINTSRRVIAEIVKEQEMRCNFSDTSIGFSRKGTIGEIRFLPTDTRFALLDSLCVINPRIVDASYLFHCLRSECLTRQCKNVTMGQALPQVSLGRVRELQIPTPCKSEQMTIGWRIDSVMKILKLESAHLNKLRKQKQGLMQDLLTGKVRVKVDQPKLANV